MLDFVITLQKNIIIKVDILATGDLLSKIDSLAAIVEGGLSMCGCPLTKFRGVLFYFCCGELASSTGGLTSTGCWMRRTK